MNASGQRPWTGLVAELRERLGEINDLGRARALLAWDERTMMPPGGAAARAEQLATLTRLRHQRLSSDDLGRLLDQLRSHAEGLPHDSDEASLARVSLREWEKARRVPSELRGEIARASSLAERAWEEAKRRSDFGLFLPHLVRNIELKGRYSECFEGFDDFEHPYDPLLDDYEPGVRTAQAREVLEQLKEGLLPLVSAATEHSEAVDDSCLHGHFPVAVQAEVVRKVVAELPLGTGSWRLDTTVHPFATAIARGDIRLTTRYDESYIGAALFSAIHEAGHGIYEAGIDRGLERTLLCAPASLAFHESQSRMWENWVGRGRPFLRHILPLLRSTFPERLGSVEAEELYRAANRVYPSLIRMEADEVTYNLHILLRFELELEIVEGRIELRDLPEIWNDRTSRYLGIEVPDDARGVLQDVHWAAGSIGYFPTYSLGNVIAGQVWEVARAALPDLEESLAGGDSQPLRDWLGDRIYRHGHKFPPAELLERAVGEPLSVDPYLRRLQDKVGDLYGEER